MDRWTPLVIVSLPLLIGALDACLLYAGTNTATISYTALKVSTRHPYVPLAVSYSFAVLMGHLFFPDLEAEEPPVWETLTRMGVVLSPTFYCLAILVAGGGEFHREALAGHDWKLALAMLACAVVGGVVGHYGLPQHLPPPPS